MGRFIQADSIIPQQQGVQAWDRYAYTNNNPVSYTDPSGNLVCSDPHVADGDCSDEGAGLWRFGITLNGNWSADATEVIRKEVVATALSLKALCGISCSGMTFYQVFNRIFGDQIVSLLKDNENAGCELLNCSEGTNAYLLSSEGPGLIIHELGHIFDHHINGAWGFGRSLLENATIVDMNNNYVEGVPFDGGSWARTNEGYRCNTYPCQQHPLNTDGGNTPGEDFADMFMNFILDTSPIYDSGGFAYNPAGMARYNWMYDFMKIWVSMSLHR